MFVVLMEHFLAVASEGTSTSNWFDSLETEIVLADQVVKKKQKCCTSIEQMPVPFSLHFQMSASRNFLVRTLLHVNLWDWCGEIHGVHCVFSIDIQCTKMKECHWKCQLVYELVTCWNGTLAEILPSCKMQGCSHNRYFYSAFCYKCANSGHACSCKCLH